MYTGRVTRSPRKRIANATAKDDLCHLIVCGERIANNPYRICLDLTNEVTGRRMVLSFEPDQAARVANAMLKVATAMPWRRCPDTEEDPNARP